MLFYVTFSLLAGALVVVAVPWNSTLDVSDSVARQCGTESDPSVLADYERQFQIDSVPDADGVESTASISCIQVYFHVIITNSNVVNVTDDQIRKQMTVLNQDYSRAGPSFCLSTISRIVNEDWFVNAGPDTAQQTEMKKTCRMGGASDLNVYVVGFEDAAIKGLLGYSTFPVNYAGNQKDDGVVIECGVLPGGSVKNYNLGRTLTHETGHWLGLYHTFEGGCSTPGDYVDDTPETRMPASGCPQAKETCPQAGLVLVSNFMDYAVDECMDSFTQGQSNRMTAQCKTYRNISV